MLQHEHVPHKYVLDDSASTIKDYNHDTTLNLRSTDSGSPASFTFEALGPNIFRTTFTTAEHPLPPHPAAAKPAANFENVTPVSTISEDRRKNIVLGDVTAVVDWSDSPVVSIFLDNAQKPIHRDLNFRSYAIDSSGISHYTAYKRDTLHVGLGEKAAPMNLSNRHFNLAAIDCFGYDVYRTDPMYKHIPLLINVTPKGCVAMFSTSHSRGTWAVGSEVDGLWGHYKVYRQAHGGLEEYIIIGRTVKDIVKSYADLVGFPKLVPRWALGYIGGGMKYSMLDEPRASDAHLEFVANCEKHGIPCSAFQMSSGYTVAETEPKTRNVFTWNSHRFPSPRGFTKALHKAGIRLVTNVKPYVLENHPEYEGLSNSGALFIDPRTEKTAVARLWSAGGGESGEGSHIDFTSNSGFKWWVKGIQDLRDVGVDGIWNDNNEYTIPHDDWQCALENTQTTASMSKDQNHIGLWGRAMHTELMAKASHDALLDADPETRPYVLTRSATAGTMRYACSSWSGDNTTSWKGMKGANALSLNAGMSLLQSYGHDIGGFEGPQPSPELLLRWIQLGIYSPRFTINCFKTSPENNLVGDIIEPWMYPEITPLIRDTIKRRYEIMPYLYSLSLESHLTAIPPQRWTGWGYEVDPEVWTNKLLKGEKQYWLGDALLIGGVYEAGRNTQRMYLPRSTYKAPILPLSASTPTLNTEMTPEEGYINLTAPFQHLPAGNWAIIASEWKTSIPLLAKIGSAIPVGKPVATASPLDDKEEFPSLVDDDWRGVEIFPPKGGVTGHTWKSTWYEDDGLSAQPEIVGFTIEYSSNASQISVHLSKKVEVKGRKPFVPLWKDLAIILPVGDERLVVSEDLKIVVGGRDARGRLVFTLLSVN